MAYSTPYTPADTTKVDSTLQFKVHAWRINLMVSEINSGRICDSLSKQQAKELIQAQKLQVKSDTALAISKRQTKVAKKEAGAWSDRYDVKNLQVEEANKEKKRFRNQRNLAIVIDILLIVLLAL